MVRQLQHGGPSSAAQPASASDGAARPSFLPDGAEQPADEGNTMLQEHATTPSSNAAQAVLLVPARPSPVPTKPATQQEQQVATPSSSAGQPAPAPALLGSVHQCDIN